MANLADDVRIMLAATRAAARIKMWRSAHGQYPSDLRQVTDIGGVQYVRTTDGFVLRGRQGADDNAQLIAEIDRR